MGRPTCTPQRMDSLRQGHCRDGCRAGMEAQPHGSIAAYPSPGPGEGLSWVCVMRTSGYLVRRESSQKHGPPSRRRGSQGIDMLSARLALRRLSPEALPFILPRLSSQGEKGRPIVKQVSILSRGGRLASSPSVGPSLHQGLLPAASDKTCPFQGLLASTRSPALWPPHTSQGRS